VEGIEFTNSAGVLGVLSVLVQETGLRLLHVSSDFGGTPLLRDCTIDCFDRLLIPSQCIKLMV
jgi:hypothetical protein